MRAAADRRGGAFLVHPVHDDITLGRKLATRRVGGFSVHEVRYGGEWSVPSHAHAHANLTFVLQGAMEETVRGESRLLRACDGVLKPAGTVHSNRCGPPGVRTLVIELPDESFLPPEGAVLGSIAYATLCGPETARVALRTIAVLREVHEEVDEDLQEIVVEALAQLPARGRAESAGRWLDTVHGLLHERFATRVRVHELAHRVGLHPVYLARAFRRLCGCSITTYRRRLQLSDAARRLAGSDAALANVALRSGFADQAHFCRAFREGMGVSPGAFRRLIRGG